MWNNRLPLIKLGSLEALDLPGQGGPTILMLHGYGADAYDLSLLKDEVALNLKERWVFAQGPKEVQIGPGYFGRAWFDIDMEAHERAIQMGVELSYADRRPGGLNEARDRVLSLIKNLQVPGGDLILGGFSQGAMLSVEVALHLAQPPKALLLLSGTLADQKNLKEKAKRWPGLLFFQSHGERDPVLPMSGAQALYHCLTEAGWKGTFCPFGGGHEIPPSVIKQLQSFLKGIRNQFPSR